MKKTYNELNVEIIRFATEDVISTSGNITPEVPFDPDDDDEG
jgi:hypothetical protein